MGGLAVFPRRNRSRRRDWVGAKAARILAGDALGAVTGIRSQADRLGLSADQRGAADRACRYLENNAAYLHYDEALEAGWPIASGIVEGAALIWWPTVSISPTAGGLSPEPKRSWPCGP